MSNKFTPRVVKAAKKPHECYACCRTIPEGAVYIAYPGKDNDGEFCTMHLCLECGYLMTQKTGERATNLQQGEFQEQFIPNCLRKKREEFRKDPEACIKNGGK